ncbi:MAG: hypothetical protein OEN49_11230 [Gammaproteobacteria bacterium]|nr:hypothetical protein [Gammaproteobacteria bacterium]
MKLAAIYLTLILSAGALPGCTAWDTLQGHTRDRAAAVSHEASQTAQWWLCIGQSVGEWCRTYCGKPDKADAWREICSDSVTETPAPKAR